MHTYHDWHTPTGLRERKEIYILLFVIRLRRGGVADDLGARTGAFANDFADAFDTSAQNLDCFLV